MAGENRKVVTRQVEGGGWQAQYEDGAPNEFGAGSSPEEATQNLHEHTLQEHANLGDLNQPPAGSLGATQEAGPTINQTIGVKSDRIVTKKLQHPVEINGKTVTYTAYRESDPAVQSYGEDEQKARVQFLTDEKDRQAKPKTVVKANPEPAEAK